MTQKEILQKEVILNARVVTFPDDKEIKDGKDIKVSDGCKVVSFFFTHRTLLRNVYRI